MSPDTIPNNTTTLNPSGIFTSIKPVYKSLLISLIITLFSIPLLLFPYNYPSDDCFFYFVIAKHFAATGTSTFNTMYLTNGYHPLWMLLLSSTQYVFNFGHDNFLRAGIIISLILVLGSWSNIRNICLHFGIKGFTFIFLFIFCVLFSTGTVGSEGCLYLFLFTALFRHVLQYNTKGFNTSPLSSITLGIQFGLLFLTRLDSIFVGLSLFLYIAKRLHDNRKTGHIILIVISGLLIALPYLAWNFTTFGHIVPISGSIKSIFPHLLFNLSSLGIFGCSTGLICLLFVFYQFFIPHKKDYQALTYTCTGYVLFCFYIVCCTDHTTDWIWYYIPGLLLAPMALSITASETPFSGKSKRSLSLVFAGVFSLFVLATASRCWNKGMYPDRKISKIMNFGNPFRRWQIQSAEQLQNITGKGANVLIYDWPGIIAYYSDVNLLAIDGLTSDFKFQKEIQQYGVDSLATLKNLGYIVAPQEDIVNPDLGYVQKIVNGNKLGIFYSSLNKIPADMIALLPDKICGHLEGNLDGFVPMNVYRIGR